MGKHVRLGLLAMLMVALMALPAFAQGLAIVNHGAPNTPITVAREVMGGTGRILTIVPPAGINGVAYINAQSLFAANIVFVNLINAQFVPLQDYRICDNTGAEVANFNSPGAVSTAPFQLIVPVPLPNSLHLTSDAACAATGNQFRFTFLGATGGNPPIFNALINFKTIGVNGTVLDQTNSAVLVQVVDEYAASLRQSQHTVDVIAGTGVGFTPQTGTDPTGALGIPPIIQADSLQGTGTAAPFSIRIAVTNADVNAGNVIGGPLAVRARITINDTNSFQGVQRAFIADALGAVCDSTQAPGSPQNLNGVNNPVNGDSFLVPGATFSQTTPPGNVLLRFCVLANGNDFLSAPRLISATVTFEMCFVAPLSGCLPPNPVAGPVQAWNLSGGDIRVSGVRGNTSTNHDTLFNINNLGETDGTVLRLQVYMTGLVGAGTGPQLTPACTLNNPGFDIPRRSGLQIRATQIQALCTSQAPLLNQQVYAVRMVLTFAPGDLSANAFRQFPSGQFLELPVLKLGNAYPNE